MRVMQAWSWGHSPEVSELEGFFCVLRLRRDLKDSQKIPKAAKITVYAYGP